MKKFLILFFSLINFFTYAINSINEAEVNKYIRQKLDRDKTITFTYKHNKTDNTIEGYSDEGVLCAVTSLTEQPTMSSLPETKSKISEEEGKLKPVYLIYNAYDKIVYKSSFDLKKSINLFEVELLYAYFDGKAPYNPMVKNLINSINGIYTIYYDKNAKESYEVYKIDHKSNKVSIEQQNSEYWAIKTMDIKTLNGSIEFYNDNGKLQSTCPVKNGTPNGEFKGYRENGTLLMKTTMVNGEFKGTVTQYNEDGSIEKTFEVKNGKREEILKK